MASSPLARSSCPGPRSPCRAAPHGRIRGNRRTRAPRRHVILITQDYGREQRVSLKPRVVTRTTNPSPDPVRERALLHRHLDNPTHLAVEVAMIGNVPHCCDNYLELCSSPWCHGVKGG